MDRTIEQRASVHAALGDPIRLTIADDLVCSDRSPKELAARTGLGSNLLAHHLDVLESAGVIERFASAGDGRRKYVRLAAPWVSALLAPPVLPERVLFLCTRNSARSQLAAALWTARTGRPASSAGTDPAPRIHRGALAAARRARLELPDSAPTAIGRIPTGVRVVTVCDLAHEDLDATDDWWHWSVTDPVDDGSAAAFDRALDEIDRRIVSLSPLTDYTGTSPSNRTRT